MLPMPPLALPVKVEPWLVTVTLICWSPSGDLTVQFQLPSTFAIISLPCGPCGPRVARCSPLNDGRAC